MTTISTISAVVDASEKTEDKVREAALDAAKALNATLISVERYQKNWKLKFETTETVNRNDVHDTLMSVLWDKYRIDDDWSMMRISKREIEDQPVVVEPAATESAVMELPTETPCYQQDAAEDEANERALNALAAEKTVQISQRNSGTYFEYTLFVPKEQLTNADMVVSDWSVTRSVRFFQVPDAEWIARWTNKVNAQLQLARSNPDAYFAQHRGR